jgi:hypothetical protein
MNAMIAPNPKATLVGLGTDSANPQALVKDVSNLVRQAAQAMGADYTAAAIPIVGKSTKAALQVTGAAVSIQTAFAPWFNALAESIPASDKKLIAAASAGEAAGTTRVAMGNLGHHS